MARVFTDLTIRNLKAAPVRKEYPAGGGLFVIVNPTGRKSYAVRYRFNGKSRKLTLPKGLTLKAARAAAAAALVEVEKGTDPSATKRAQKQAQQVTSANTFKAIAEGYMKLEGARLRSADWRRDILERLVYPTLGNRPITEIRRKAVIDLLDKIEAGDLVKDGKSIRGGPVIADRTLAVIRKVMRWYAIRDENYTPPIVPGMARTSTKARARTRTLTDDELRAVWNAAGADKGAFGPYVQFLVLSAARRNEVSEMTRSEISGVDWTLPASRNKTAVDLVRPLSKAALETLARAPQLAGTDYIFSNNGRHPIRGFARFKERLDKASGVTGWTLHDLRRTARSLMSRAGVNSDHAERCLGHVIAGVRGTYDRHEYHAEKTHAYEALAAQIERIVNPVANVVSIAEARP